MAHFFETLSKEGGKVFSFLYLYYDGDSKYE